MAIPNSISISIVLVLLLLLWWLTIITSTDKYGTSLVVLHLVVASIIVVLFLCTTTTTTTVSLASLLLLPPPVPSADPKISTQSPPTWANPHVVHQKALQFVHPTGDTARSQRGYSFLLILCVYKLGSNKMWIWRAAFGPDGWRYRYRRRGGSFCWSWAFGKPGSGGNFLLCCRRWPGRELSLWTLWGWIG